MTAPPAPSIMELHMANISRVRALSARRLILLATVASLGVAAVAVGGVPQSLVPGFPTAMAAEAAKGPAGFGDVVEKVKPSVISVRVKMDGARTAAVEGSSPLPRDSQMERFFRRFGMPDMRMPEMGPDSRRQPEH